MKYYQVKDFNSLKIDIQKIKNISSFSPFFYFLNVNFKAFILLDSSSTSLNSWHILQWRLLKTSFAFSFPMCRRECDCITCVQPQTVVIDGQSDRIALIFFCIHFYYAIFVNIIYVRICVECIFGHWKLWEGMAKTVRGDGESTPKGRGVWETKITWTLTVNGIFSWKDWFLREIEICFAILIMFNEQFECLNAIWWSSGGCYTERPLICIFHVLP